jgi:Flp pilus assembly pilin Flp
MEGMRRLGQEDGQVLFEYALILGLVALLTVGVLTSLGHTVSGLLNHVSSSMSSVSNP